MPDKPISCRRCGKCCLANAFSLTRDEDLLRWEKEKREDIFAVIDHWHPVWAGDHIINATDGSYIHGCPFLEWDGALCTCRIYETRPITCAEYKCGSSRICPVWQDSSPDF